MSTLMTDPVLGEWVAGYYGTSDARRDFDARRRTALDAATAALRARGLTLADPAAGFEGLAAPGFALDVDIRRGFGSRDLFGVVPFDVRALVSRTRRANQARRVRRAVLDAARVRASARRAAYRRTLPSAAFCVAPRLLPHSPRPLDRYSALDEWVMNRDSERRAYEALMSVEPNRDGRGTLDYDWPVVGTTQALVNGTETRTSERWSTSSRDSIYCNEGYSETIDPETGYVSSRDGVKPDWTCYRVNPDGTRTPLVSTSTASKRKRGRPKGSTSKRTHVDVLALQTIAGTIGNVE